MEFFTKHAINKIKNKCESKRKVNDSIIKGEMNYEEKSFK